MSTAVVGRGRSQAGQRDADGRLWSVVVEESVVGGVGAADGSTTTTTTDARPPTALHPPPARSRGSQQPPRRDKAQNGHDKSEQRPVSGALVFFVHTDADHWCRPERCYNRATVLMVYCRMRAANQSDPSQSATVDDHVPKQDGRPTAQARTHSTLPAPVGAASRTGRRLLAACVLGGPGARRSMRTRHAPSPPLEPHHQPGARASM